MKNAQPNQITLYIQEVKMIFRSKCTQTRLTSFSLLTAGHAAFLAFAAILTFTNISPLRAETIEDSEENVILMGEAGHFQMTELFKSHPRIIVEEQRARDAGLEILRGKYVTLVTDLPLNRSVREIVSAVDAAYPILCQFFGIHENPDWMLNVFLMKEKEPFLKANYIPDILPPFQNGFSFNYDCWVFEQPSEYYRRHLVLHEMVHSFSSTLLGDAGPDWFAEGMAEMLATHSWIDGKLTLGIMPENKNDVPFCGRIREIRNAVRRGEIRSFEQLANPKPEDYGTNAIYYWSWAWVWFLHNDPDAKNALHAIIPALKERKTHLTLTEDFLKNLEENRTEIEKRWLIFIARLEYGFDPDAEFPDTSPGKPLEQEKNAKTIKKFAANRGWQNSGIQLKKGQIVRVRSKGSFEIIQNDHESWLCETNGVSIEYHLGQPLGILQAVILKDGEKINEEDLNDRQPGTFHEPIEIGTARTFTVPFDGTVFLRLNLPSAMLKKTNGKFLAEITLKNNE